MFARLIWTCRLFPSVAPHGPHAPNSIWRLDWTTWVGIAAHVDAYLAEADRQSTSNPRR